MGVLLLAWVGGLTEHVLESEAELCDVRLGSLCELERAKQFLELLEHVVVDHLLVVLFEVFSGLVDGPEQGEAELGNHEALLES